MEVMVKSEPFKGWKGLTGLIIGVFLVALGLMPQSFSTSKIFLGVICVFISGVKKTVSLNESGLIEQISVWGIRKEKKSPWSNIDSLNVDKKGDVSLVSAQIMGKIYKFSTDEDSARVIAEMFFRNHPDLF